MQGHAESSSHSYRQSASESGPGLQHTSYRGLEKPAVQMLNGLKSPLNGDLTASGYDGDSAPGGETGGHRGVGHGECPAPVSCP